MANQLTNTLQVGTQVIVKDEYDNLIEATVTKRTATQCITTDDRGRTIRWAGNWKGEPRVYGNKGYGRTSDLLMPDSPAVAHARAAKEAQDFENKFRGAFAAANVRHPSIEAVEALQAVMPEWLERAKARRAESEAISAKWEAEKAARDW